MALRLYFCLPGFVALLALGTDWDGRFGIASIGAVLALLILLGRVGKWPALVSMWLVWMIAGLVVIVTLSSWPVAIGAVLAVWLASFAAVRMGGNWGHARYRRLAAAGRGIRECEWVFTGADYVTEHPLNRLSLGLWLSVVAFVVAAALVLFDLAMGLAAWWEWALVLVFVLPIWPILARQPVAYPMVIGAFIAAVLTLSPVLMALMAPVLVYWVDGVRPNLIYRHRFERMLPPGGPDVS
ncbi:hypothetical protein [Gymnodinialimonas hymeniacidonis]|uniref:hypothetical protein n=1 Tax=Gymnodinialimonas hymeniacidonis TaxID=3126508 RepID=UPI0034C69E09